MTNTLKTALLLGALSALLLFIGEALGGAQGLLLGFLFAAVTNFVSYWFSDKIVLAMYRAQEVGAGHRLYATVGAACAARRTCRCRACTSFPTARRTRLRPAAIRSTRPWRRPKASCGSSAEEELDGVIAHELAHVKHRDILISSVAATLAAAIMMVARFAMFFGGSRATTARARTPSRCCS